MFKSKWSVLFLILVVVTLFSLFAVPEIAISGMDTYKDKIVTVQPE